MRRVLLGVGAVVALTGIGGLSACGVGSDCDFGLCAGPPADGDGGNSGDGGPSKDGEAPAPPGCDDLSKGPKDAPACIDDSVGIFVSPTGDDGADGTKSKP